MPHYINRVHEKRKLIKLNELPPGWMDRPEEDVIFINENCEDEESDINIISNLIGESTEEDSEGSTFESVYNNPTENQPYSIAHQSIYDLTTQYHLCSAYLGDLLCALGCKPPLDKNAPLGNFVNGEQMYSVLEALLTWEPYAINECYQNNDIRKMADDLGVPTEKIVQICNTERINLPFGLSSRLHVANAEKIFKCLEMDRLILGKDDRENGEVD
jgi:hypothetical protein